MSEHKQSKHGPAWHTALLMLLDAFLTVAAMMMALQIYYDMEAPQAHIVHVWHIAPILAVLTVGFFYAVGLYKTLMRYASVEALVQIATGALLASGTTYGSSPRVWGQAKDGATVVVSNGIIPTRMGTSKQRYRNCHNRRDHPHAYGDKY